jgi:tripartite-type tricarboxylate transporter receptor subunit TctC
VAKAVPDGHALRRVDSVHVLAPLFLEAPYDPIKSFTAIGTVASSELVLVMHPSVPVKKYAEFID